MIKFNINISYPKNIITTTKMTTFLYSKFTYKKIVTDVFYELETNFP